MQWMRSDLDQHHNHLHSVHQRLVRVSSTRVVAFSVSWAPENSGLAFTSVEQPFDVAIALTPEAADIARRYFADSPTRVESWELPDPTRFYYDVRQMMNDYRAVRDNIEMRLERRFGASRRIS